jgi:hypothetical protein
MSDVVYWFADKSSQQGAYGGEVVGKSPNTEDQNLMRGLAVAPIECVSDA